MRLIQLSHPKQGRRIARVEGSQLALIDRRWPTAWDLFSKIIAEGADPGRLIGSVLSGDKLDYDPI